MSETLSQEHIDLALSSTELSQYKVDRNSKRVGGQGCFFKTSKKTDSDEKYALKLQAIPSDEVKAITVRVEKLFRTRRNVVKVEDWGIISGGEVGCSVLYYLMEYADKGDVSELLSSQLEPFAPEEFFKFSMNVLTGVKSLHDDDLIHRDLKPRNVGVFEDDGSVIYRIIDLDSIELAESDEPAPKPVPSYYCAPERVEDPEISGSKSIDVYEIGTTLLSTLGWNPREDSSAHDDVESVIKELKKCGNEWHHSALRKLKDSLNCLLNDKDNRCDIDEAIQKFTDWNKRRISKTEVHHSSKRVNLARLASAALGVILLAVILLYVGVFDTSKIVGGSSEPDNSVSEKPAVPPETVDPFGMAFIDSHNNPALPLVIVISGADETTEFKVAHANGQPKYARDLRYDASLPPDRRFVPKNLWAGTYHVLCEDYPEYSSEITIDPHVSAIEVHTGKIRESGKAGLVANTTATIVVRGRNMPESLALYLGGISARRYEVSKRNNAEYSNNGDKFRSTPESIYFMLKVPNRIGAEQLQVYLTAGDFQNGYADALIEPVELYSTELDKLIVLSKLRPNFYLLKETIDTPAGIVVVRQWAANIRVLTTQCSAFERTGIVLPAAVADNLIANLEHWVALVHLSMSSRNVKYKYKNVKALRSMYDTRVNNINDAITAWTELSKVCDSPALAKEIKHLEDVLRFFKWMLKGEEPVKPYMKAVSISSSALVEKDDILSAIGLDGDSSIADRKKKLDECIISGEVWFKFHLRVKNFNNELKSYKSNGKSYSSIAVPHSVEIDKTWFKIEFDKPKSKWPLKWELGDTVEVEVRVHWKRTEYLVVTEVFGKRC